MKATSVAFATLLLISTSVLPANAAYNGVDPNVAGTFGISLCETAEQLDCLESIKVKEFGQEAYLPASFVSQTLYPANKDKLGNKNLTGYTTWTYLSGETTKQFTINAELATPKRKLVKEQGTPGYAGGFAIWVLGDESDLTTNYRVTARTSWFKPVDVSMFAADAEFEYSKIAGGHKWIFSGTRTIQSGYEDDWAKKMASNANADYDNTRFFFGADYAGKNMNESYYDSRCATKGFTVRASNATSAGQATWNSSTRSLEFNIDAPHRTTKGDLNMGFFKLWVNKDYMKCMWPNSGLDRARNFSVGVYNENGKKQVATTVVRYNKGELKVDAYNFHYSAPTIRVKAKK